MLGAFLAATYTPRAAGGWYRGAGATSIADGKVTYEVWVRASTPAQALAFCPPIANAAGYFLGSSSARLTLNGRIDVPLGSGMTFKDAAFPPVTCTPAPDATDPVRATMPTNAAAATARLTTFLDDYFRRTILPLVTPAPPRGCTRTCAWKLPRNQAINGRSVAHRVAAPAAASAIEISMRGAPSASTACVAEPNQSPASRK